MGSLTEVCTLQGHTARVWSVSWSPEGDLIASCSSDRTIRLWTQEADAHGSWHCKQVLQDAHKKTIRSVAWSPGGASLVSASFDGTTVIWRKAGEDWQQTAILEGHENEVKSAVYSPSGSLLATCGRDKTVWVWESFPGDDFECADVKYGHSQDVKMVAWHPSTSVLASASYDNTIKLWMEDPDGSEWNCAQTLEGVHLGHDSTVWSIAFSADGLRMASGSEDTSVKVWSCDMKDGAPFYKLEQTLAGHHRRAVFSVAWSSDGCLATASGDNCIRVFAREEGKWVLVAERERAHEQDVNCVAWHPHDHETLASCSDDGTVQMWCFARDP